MRRLSLPSVGILAAAIVVAVSILRAVGFLLGDTAGLASYTWYVADGLACGALIAVLLRYPVSRRRVTRIAIGLILGTLVLCGLGAPFGLLTRNRLLGAALQYTVISIFFGGVLLLFLLLGTGPYARIIQNKTLRFFGYISYGLYLVHLMVFRLYDQFCHRFSPALLPRDNHLELVFLRSWRRVALRCFWHTSLESITKTGSFASRIGWRRRKTTPTGAWLSWRADCATQ